MTRSRLALTLALGLLALGRGVHGQQAPPSAAPVFRVGVDGVRVDVLVTQGGQAVAGLQSGDFELFDNGVRQRIDAISLADLPIDVILALDVSGSVAGERIASLRDAADAVVDALHEGDRAALVTFSHAVNVLTPLTTARELVKTRLAEVRADGYTSLGDGAYVALTMPGDVRRSTLIVLFSDGQDTMSWLSHAAVLDAAKRSGSVVCVVSIGRDRSVDRELPSWMRRRTGDPRVAMLATNPADAAFARFLDDVAAATGGSVIEIEHRAPTRTAFLDVLARFRARYQLTYTLTGVKTPGEHRIAVHVKRPGAKVRARPGYRR